MGAMWILLVIDDGVNVCICFVYFYVFKEVTQHAFLYDSHFSTKEKSECCGEIIDNISYAPICLLEEKYIKIKDALKNMLSKFFDGNCNVGFLLKVTVNDSSWHTIDLYWLVYWNLNQ